MPHTTTNGKPKTNRMSSKIVRDSLQYDAHFARIIDAPDPAKMAALLEQIDNGELGLLCQLQLEMERKSDIVACVSQTRRNAIGSLPWSIEPDPNADEDDAFAQEVAEYVSDTLTDIDMWESVLEHLDSAIGPSLAVVETIWEKAAPVDFVIVNHRRLAAHPITNRGVVIRTDDNYMGYPTEEFPNKFIVFVPHSKGGFPFRTTLTHASIRSYLMAYHSTVDWMAFSELFGCPVRTATHDETAMAADIDTVRQEINEGGTDVAIITPKGWELDFKQALGTGETYQKQLAHTDGAIAKLWLGQTLTTDVGDSGSRALGDVHNEVRHDIRDSDIRKKTSALRHQLFRTMARLKFPNAVDLPVPVMVLKTYEARDVESERLTLEQLQFARTERLMVNSDWLYESLNIPKPVKGALPEVIKLGESAPKLTEGTAPDDEPQGDKKENVSN